ncbi:hypothetical protein FACS1894105_12490 [Clostridia bacterium]|nr:hypothetical protein FACS1894105_12490 [Clostridia bacterium]
MIPGFVRTGLFKSAPWFFRAYVAVKAAFSANSVETAARIPVRTLLEGEGKSAFMWNKQGEFEHGFAIEVDSAVQKTITDISKGYVGV